METLRDFSGIYQNSAAFYPTVSFSFLEAPSDRAPSSSFSVQSPPSLSRHSSRAQGASGRRISRGRASSRRSPGLTPPAPGGSPTPAPQARRLGEPPHRHLPTPAEAEREGAAPAAPPRLPQAPGSGLPFSPAPRNRNAVSGAATPGMAPAHRSQPPPPASGRHGGAAPPGFRGNGGRQLRALWSGRAGRGSGVAGARGGGGRQGAESRRGRPQPLGVRGAHGGGGLAGGVLGRGLRHAGAGPGYREQAPRLCPQKGGRSAAKVLSVWSLKAAVGIYKLVFYLLWVWLCGLE